MNLLWDFINMMSSTLIGVYIILVWMRFLLQLVHADFYNPISQFVVKSTSPLLHPLRRIIPAFGGMDVAALVLIVLLKMVDLALSGLLTGNSLPPVPLLAITVFALAGAAISFYLVAIFIGIILSWVAAGGGGHNPSVALIFQLTEPVLAPCRRLLPAMGGFDLSPMIALFVLKAFARLLLVAIMHSGPLLGAWSEFALAKAMPVLGF